MLLQKPVIKMAGLRLQLCCIFLILTVGILTRAITAKRILLLPHPTTSHARQLAAVGDQLADNGHEVYMVFQSSFPDIHRFEGGKIEILTHAEKLSDFHTQSDEKRAEQMKMTVDMRDIMATWRVNIPELENIARNQLQDEKLYQKLKSLNFDLAIVDIFPMSRSLLVLPYSLGIPYVAITTMLEPWIVRNPALPSFVPSNMIAGDYTPKMDFWQRLHNLWVNIEWSASPRVRFLEDAFVQEYIRDQPLTTMNGLVAKCMLVLVDVDPLLDYPRPQMPHEIFIGGLGTKPAAALPVDLEDFMNSAPNGVVVMSFGSMSFEVDPHNVQEFIKAFAKIKLHILWKYVKEPEGLPANVKVVSWFPQNDLLGHPRTKMFITHCGNNGQMEAVYHGVPMIGFPLFGDQRYNCKRLTYHDYGICLDPMDFKANDLVRAVSVITQNRTYVDNIKRASQIFNDSPMTPQETALFWVEHVLKYGGKHLHSYALDMPWYQYLMLDIAAFVFSIIVAFILACAFLIHLLLKASSRSTGTPHQKRD